MNLNIDSTDVLHSWFVPALGPQVWAVPGEIQELSFIADEEGLYRGRSTVFSGAAGYPVMRANVRVVSAQEYEDYIEGLNADLQEGQEAVQRSSRPARGRSRARVEDDAGRRGGRRLMAPPTIAERRPEVVTREIPAWREGWTTAATSADHKVVAKLFMGTSLSFLAIAALAFALTRIQLIVPDSTLIRPDIFSQMSTTAMTSITVLFGVPFVLGLLGYIVPLQIGARGVALPRLNQLAYWLYAAGTLVFFVSFLYLVPETGLSPLPPMSDDVFSPSGGVDAWIGGVGLATLGFICWAINMIATLKNMRAPGMAWRRAPVLAWGARVISYVVLITGAAMVAALVMLAIDRNFDGVFFDAGEGGEPMLFSHLSWLYFTGIHTVMVVAALAVISEIIPTFSRKPLFSHSAVTGSLVAVGVLGTLAWMQNLYASPLAEGFAFFTMLVAVLLPGPDRPHLRRLDADDVGRRGLDPRSAGPRDRWRGRCSCSGSAASSRPRSSASGSCSRTPSPRSRTRSWSSPASSSRCSRRSTTGFRRSPAGPSTRGRPRPPPRLIFVSAARLRPLPCSSPGSPASRSTSSATSRATASRRST